MVFFLSLTWGLLLCGNSLLATLLWLEVAGLLVLLLLGFSAYGIASSTFGANSWRPHALGEVGNQETIQALLLLLWVNGLATIFFLFGWVLVSTLGANFSFELHNLVGCLGRMTPANRSSLWVGGLVFALLLKLLLQPLHFFLVSFYKTIPLFTLTQYLLFYYTPLVPCLFFFFLGPLSPFVSLGVLF